MQDKLGQENPGPNYIEKICQVCQDASDQCKCADKKICKYQWRAVCWLEQNWRRSEFWLTICAILLWLLGIYFVFFSAPAGFPAGVVVRVNKGSSVSQVATAFYEHGMIRSPLLFKILTRIIDDGEVIAGDYKFVGRPSVVSIVERLTRGIYGIETTKLTILEGHSVRELANLLAKNLPVFDKEEFLLLAADQEGKLFPDTYFIKPTDDEADIVKMMTDNFSLQIKPLESQISKSGHTMDEIITMASIIELEARTEESREMVSGILWNRLERDMKLQVDCVFPYIMGKYSLNLTVNDLQVDSPYNTYRYAGLPPTPIDNPGLSAIKAALNPTKTDYLYYLSDSDGEMHYAKTYTEHMANRAKYLSN